MRTFLLILALVACAAPPPSKSATPRPRPLEGTSWVMVQEENARGAPTLDFLESERASGFTGCNHWFAQVSRTSSALSFEAIGMTRRACEESAMQIEHDFADRLERTRAAQIDESTLTLIGENGEAVATFERAR